MFETIETNLQYLALDIPVTITQKPLEDLLKVPVIQFVQASRSSHPICNTLGNNCLIVPDYEAYILLVILSDKLYEVERPEHKFHLINSRIKNSMKFMFDKVDEIGELSVILSGNADFILPIIDYVTDRHWDFKHITIYISQEEGSEFFTRVRNLIRSNRLIENKQTLYHDFYDVYGDYSH